MKRLTEGYNNIQIKFTYSQSYHIKDFYEDEDKDVFVIDIYGSNATSILDEVRDGTMQKVWANPDFYRITFPKGKTENFTVEGSKVIAKF